MNWSPQQSEALIDIRKWISGGNRTPQVYRLFGWAGTGKSTIANEAMNMARVVSFAAFTGKAALVMQRKGCHNAKTIHSLIYKPKECPKTGKPTFVLNHNSEVLESDLIVIDEVSMVGDALAQDLLSFGIKILVLGDPFQLPPVKDAGYFTECEPDYMLTEIHRQAADNPIIRLSMIVREGGTLPLGTYGESRVVQRSKIDKDEVADICMDAGQVICGTNKLRHTLNQRMRVLHNRVDEFPEPGDKLVCLRNNREKAFLNGGIWSVVDSKRRKLKMARGRDYCKMVVKADDSTVVEDANTPEVFFTHQSPELSWSERKEIDEFTYGYALTCHKSQGSQWDAVAVFNESGAFREHKERWLYTAITRAAERVTVFE